MKILIIIGIIVGSVLFFITTLSLVRAGVMLAHQGIDDSYSLGSFMGRLLTEFVVLAVLTRLIKRVRRPIK